MAATAKGPDTLCNAFDSEVGQIHLSFGLLMNPCTCSIRILMSCLIILTAGLLRLSASEQTETRWKAYLEYFDPTKKESFICSYDVLRVQSPPGSPGMKQVWEKVVPRGDRFEDRGEPNGTRLQDTTSLYEIDCREWRFRILETYSHYGDAVRYDLDPSSWQEVSTGSRQEHLLGEVCDSPF
jgi:hypothetical protein